MELGSESVEDDDDGSKPVWESLVEDVNAPRVAQESRSTLLVSCPSKTATLHRAMSYGTPQLITPSTGTPSSHILHPPLSEDEPCGDLPPHLSGALVEPRPFSEERRKSLMGGFRHVIESPLWAWVRDFLSSEDVLQMRTTSIK